MQPSIVPAAAAAVIVATISLRLYPHGRRRAPVAHPPQTHPAGATPSVRRRVGARRRHPLDPDVVAAWCDDLARLTRAGVSLSSALSESVPADQALREAITPLKLAIERGRPFADALTTVNSGERGAEHLALACSVIAVTARLGGPPGAPIDRVAAALRQRGADHHERTAQAAQARMSAHVMTAVPVTMLALLLATDGDVRRVVTEPLGAGCLTLGLILNAAGWCWMQTVVGR